MYSLVQCRALKFDPMKSFETAKQWKNFSLRLLEFCVLSIHKWYWYFATEYCLLYKHYFCFESIWLPNLNWLAINMRLSCNINTLRTMDNYVWMKLTLASILDCRYLSAIISQKLYHIEAWRIINRAKCRHKWWTTATPATPKSKWKPPTMAKLW